MNKLVLMFAASTCLSSIAIAEERHMDAHEHGVSALKIAQQGAELSLVLEAPGSDIVGFEHAPENDEEKAAVASALEILENPETLFQFSSDANCSVTEKEAEFETEEDHAEFHVHWEMSCGDISAASSINIDFFNKFARAEEVEVEAVGDKGQGAFEVESDMTSLDLSEIIGD